MTTTILCSVFFDRTLVVRCSELNMLYVCDSSDFNKQHNGIWNSRVMAFVPPLPDTFSDGTPVAHYDEPYTDNSGTYFDECVVCEVPTQGNAFCGSSCEQQDVEGISTWEDIKSGRYGQ